VETACLFRAPWFARKVLAASKRPSCALRMCHGERGLGEDRFAPASTFYILRAPLGVAAVFHPEQASISL
jgi:hypothetical protein